MKIGIVSFFCGRPVHSKLFLTSLSKVNGISHCGLYIFLDKCNCNISFSEISKFKEYFSDIIVYESPIKMGLRENILFGIDYCLSENDICLVLENDLEVSFATLDFVIEFIRKSEEFPQVKAGCLYSFNINNYRNNKKNTKLISSNYFLSWGWVVRKTVWKQFKSKIDEVDFFWIVRNFKKFNANYSNDYFFQILINSFGIKRTWAIYFYYFLQKHKGVVLLPEISLIRNIGWDGSGENCNINEKYKVKSLPDKLLVDSQFILEDYVGDLLFEEFHRANGKNNFIRNYLWVVKSYFRSKLKSL